MVDDESRVTARAPGKSAEIESFTLVPLCFEFTILFIGRWEGEFLFAGM